MEIENTKKSVRINQVKYITMIGFLVLVIVLLTTRLVRDEFLGLNKYHWAIVVILLYILENLYEYLKDFNYIYYNDEGRKLLFRYVSLRPFHNKRLSIEIEKDKFKGYNVLRDKMGFKQQIVFYIKTPQGTAKYPPVSITALNENEFNQLKQSLNKHSTDTRKKAPG